MGECGVIPCRFLGFHAGAQEVLAFSDHSNDAPIRWADYPHAGLGGSSVCLYVVLIAPVSMLILGISAFYHDSAAALVRDGDIIAAAQEERFTRKKHDADFPANAIRWCLADAGITGEQVDRVAFYDKPFLKFERLLETYLAFAPRGFRSFSKAM